MDKYKNIVVVHGWGKGSTKLEPLGKELGKLGWSVKLIKLPGFELAEPKSVWGVREYTDYVEGEIPKDWKARGYVWFGHSFGGRLAIRAAAEAKPGLKAIVLCSPGGFEDRSSLKLAVFSVLAKLGKGILGNNDMARKVLYKIAGVGDYSRAKPMMREVLKKVVSEDLRSLLPAITIPTLILWGDKDRVVPVGGGAFIKDRIPNSRLEISLDEGHLLPYNQPRWVAERIGEWAASK